MSLALGYELDQRDLPGGTILKREYLGEVYVVEVLPAGYNPTRRYGAMSVAEKRRRMWRYLFRGMRHRTLSAITYEITGDRFLSGNRFFGLRRRSWRK